MSQLPERVNNNSQFLNSLIISFIAYFLTISMSTMSIIVVLVVIICSFLQQVDAGTSIKVSF